MRARFVLVAALSIAPVVHAQDDASDVATARTLGTEGLRLAEQGDCRGAVDKLARAEQLHHAPTTLERLGECQVSLGHYVDGTESLRRVIRERLASDAPAVFTAAQARARDALDKALAHLAKVRIDVVGPSASDVTLKIDGASVSNATLGVERPIDPGDHVVEASAAGFKRATGRVKVDAGGSGELKLTLEPAPVPVVVRQPNPTAPIAPTPAPTTITKRNYAPAAIALGLAGAGLAVGGVLGGVALAKKNDLVAACGGTACSASQKPAFDDLSTFATISTIGFVVAGVAAVVGIVLIAVAPKHTVVEQMSFAVSPQGAVVWGTF
ncbi:MAG TPA: hypothetical protein VGH28_25515 [Polyangiaceae bacterium]|jgi:hypothetical protein